MTTLLWLSLAVFVQDAQPGPLREIEELRREVETLREINRLEFTRDQLAAVVKAVEEGAKRVEEVAAGAKRDIDALATELGKLRDALAKGEKPDPEQEQRIGEAQGAVGELMQDMERVYAKVVADVKAAVNEKQWKRIQALGRPDPLRPLRDGFGRLVDHMLEDPGFDPYEPIHEHLSRMARPLGWDEKDVEAEAQRIAKIADEAASDAAFESKRDDYVRRAFDEGKVAEASKKMGPPAEESGRRLGQMLTDRRTIKTLKLRLDAMK